MNLKSRIEKLEAAIPTNIECYCLVAHGEDCQASKAEAVTRFVEKHGYAPQNFINIIGIDTKTKKAICGCESNHGT